MGLIASMGGGRVAVCGVLSDCDAPSSPELTVGADGDAVDRYVSSPPGIVRQGGNET